MPSIPYYDNGGGVDQKTSPTQVADAASSASLNIDYTTEGSIRTRDGSRILNVDNDEVPQPINDWADNTVVGMFQFTPSTKNVATEVIAAGQGLYLGFANPVLSKDIGDPTIAYPDFELFTTADDEWLLYGNGIVDNLKYNEDKGGWFNLSLETPPAPVPVDNGAGALAAGDYNYYVAYARTDVGVVVQLSPLSPVGSVNIGANRQISVGIPVSTDPQVNARVIYRESPTSGGETFELTVVNNNVDVAYVDNDPLDGTTIADFTIAATPTTAIMEEYLGRLYTVPNDRLTDVRYSEVGEPWNSPVLNAELFD
ncbi:MAG: hypothetical protein ACYS1A_19265, partial [Planctomycetota bacterium]